MDEYQWNPFGIVRLKKTKTFRASEMTYRERALPIRSTFR